MSRKIDLTCIIDDDPIFRFGTRRIMELADFCKGFLVFNNGKEALDALRAHIEADEQVALPDVILLDLNMPIMDGWQFLDAFMQIPTHKQILVYIVTSSIDPEDIKRAKMYDIVNNYIVKPVTVDKLHEIMKAIKAA